MARSVRVALAVLAISTLILWSPASASTTVTHDAIGDVRVAIPYLDIVQAKVTAQVGRGLLYFSTQVAAPPPSSGTQFAAYNWVVSQNDGSADYSVTLRWCNHSQHPTCLGETSHWEAVITNLRNGMVAARIDSFRVDDTTVKVFVSPELIGGSEFTWVAVARNRRAAPGDPDGVDRAPDDTAVQFP